MLKPSSTVSAITLTAFCHFHLATIWAHPVWQSETALNQKSVSTLYLGQDPFTKTLLRLQYDTENKILQWQLLNHGHIVSHQSLELPADTKSVDIAAIYQGDQIVIAGESSHARWFLQAINSQGEFQWQRRGEGKLYDLAFSYDGQQVYSVGQSEHSPLFIALNANSGEVQFHTEYDHSPKTKNHFIYKQLVITGDKELVVGAHRNTDGHLDYIKWQTDIDAVTGDLHWRTDETFCEKCKRTGVKAIALSNSENSSYFFAVTSSENELTLEIKDSAQGKTINNKIISPKAGHVDNWHTVLKINVPQDLSEQIRAHEKASDVGWLSGSQLLLTRHECLIGLGFHNTENSYHIDLCQSSAFAPHRKLLQDNEADNDNNVTTMMPDTMQDDALQGILTAVEVTASVLGIVGAITLITGFISFMNSQWNKHKENINNALDKENQRRHKEGDLLKGLPGTKPFIPFNPGGSVYDLSATLPSILGDQGHVDDGQKILDTLVKHSGKTDHTAVNKWLTENKEHLSKKDDKGYTVLHRLANMSIKKDESDPPNPERLSIANKLLRHGASTDTPSDQEQLTPLQMAAASDDADLFELLLSRKLELDFDELSVLFHLAVHSGGSNVLQILINRELYSNLKFTQQTNSLRDLWKINKVSIQTEEGYTLLHEAVLANNTEALELLLNENFIPIDAEDSKGNTALHLAVLDKERESTVDELLRPRGVTRRHASVSAKNKEDNQPLHMAAQVADNEDIIQKLLKESASLTSKNKSNRTPLDLACERGLDGNIGALLKGSHTKPDLHSSVLHFMARNGYREAIHQMGTERLRTHINSLDKGKKQNPLQISIAHNHHGTAAALISAGANVSTIKPHDSFTHGLLFFAASENDIELLQKLIDDGWDLEQTNSHNQTATHIAAYHGFSNFLRLLHDNHAQMDKPDKDGNTPLHLAAMNGMPYAIKFLLSIPTNINLRNNVGNTPSHMAVINNGFSLLDTLIENEADIALANGDGYSVVQLALSRDKNRTLRVLSRSKRSLNEQDTNGQTAVHLAILHKRLNDLELLSEAGACLTIADTNDQQPIHLAAISGNVSALMHLTRNNININTIDGEGNTPLHLAARNGMSGAIKYLIQSGAESNQQNNDLNTPAHLAIMHLGFSQLDVLINNGAELSVTNNQGDSVINLALRKNEALANRIFQRCKINISLIETSPPQPAITQDIATSVYMPVLIPAATVIVSPQASPTQDHSSIPMDQDEVFDMEEIKDMETEETHL